MKTLKNILNKVDAFIEYLFMGVLLLLVALVFMQVFCRYILKFTPTWSEETSIILMIWMGFITSAIGVKKGMHLSISAVVGLFPKSIQKVFYYFDEIAVFIFGYVLVRYGGELSIHTMSSIMPATEIPSGFLYLCLPVSGIMICFYCIMRIINLTFNKEN